MASPLQGCDGSGLMCYPVGDFSFGSAPTLSSARSPAPNTLFEPPWRIIAASARPPSRTRRAANARRSRPPVLRRWRGPPRSRPTPDPRASAPRAHADRSSGRRAPRRSPPPPASGSAPPPDSFPSSAPSGTATVAPAPSRSVFERRILSTTPSGSKARSATSSATSSLRAQPAKRRSRERSRHTEMTERKDIIRFAGTPPGRKERGLSPDLPLAWIQGQRIVGTPSAKALAPWLNR
jgi:hypothetical protein